MLSNILDVPLFLHYWLIWRNKPVLSWIACCCCRHCHCHHCRCLSVGYSPEWRFKDMRDLIFCAKVKTYPSLWSQVLSREYPSLWFQVISRGYPSPVTGPVQSPVPGPAGWGEVLHPGQDRTGGTPPPRQESKWCYTASGMPLTVTQKDLLVLEYIKWFVKWADFHWAFLFKIKLLCTTILPESDHKKLYVNNLVGYGWRLRVEGSDNVNPQWTQTVYVCDISLHRLLEEHHLWIVFLIVTPWKYQKSSHLSFCVKIWILKPETQDKGVM